MKHGEWRYITEAESHVELLRDKKSLHLPEIEEILARNTAETGLVRKIEESPAREVLGDHPDLGVELIGVPGIYKGRRNEIEARAIVAAAVHHMTHRPELSLGICTMNSDQKELILEEFERERDRKPAAYMPFLTPRNGARRAPSFKFIPCQQANGFAHRRAPMSWVARLPVFLQRLADH